MIWYFILNSNYIAHYVKIRLNEYLQRQSNSSLAVSTNFTAGLQFIVEFQDDDPRVNPKYVCNLCEDILERRYVISHCFGKSHRYKYLVSNNVFLIQNIRDS